MIDRIEAAAHSSLLPVYRSELNQRCYFLTDCFYYKRYILKRCEAEVNFMKILPVHKKSKLNRLLFLSVYFFLARYGARSSGQIAVENFAVFDARDIFSFFQLYERKALLFCLDDESVQNRKLL